jgi:hypothetical protein
LDKMTNDGKDSRPGLHRLTEALVEDILAASDEELEGDVRAAGQDPTEMASSARATIEAALSASRKARLKRAQSEISRTRGQDTNVVRLQPTDARARLSALLSAHPERTAAFTMAARKAGELSDADVQALLEDLEELGLRLPDEGRGS